LFIISFLHIFIRQGCVITNLFILKHGHAFLYNILLNRESSVNTLTSQKSKMFTQPVITSQKIMHLNYKDETFNFKQNNCSLIIVQNTGRRKIADYFSI